MHLKIPSIRGLPVPPVHSAARNGSENITVATLPYAKSTVSPSKISLPRYMFRFSYSIYSRHFISMVMEVASSHLVSRNSCRDMVVAVWAHRVPMWGMCSWHWNSATHSSALSDVSILYCGEE